MRGNIAALAIAGISILIAAYAVMTRPGMLASSSPELAIAACLARIQATRALDLVTVDLIQIHGGVGYTWEYDIQLYLKRSKWVRSAFGDADFHYDRVAQLGGYA